LDDDWGGVLKYFKSLKDIQEFFDDFIQLHWSYRHKNVILHKGIAFFRTRNIKRKDKTITLRGIF
jgi:predicted transposase YbfD/YdcC